MIFVAGMLPLSCIVHCHVNATSAESPALNLFVCHPFTTVDTESPQHLHAHTVALRATHEVAMLIAGALVYVALQHTLGQRQPSIARWYPHTVTPPPR